MKLFRKLYLFAQLLLVVGPLHAAADDAYYDCEVAEHLSLTEEGYRRTSDPIIGSHLRLDKQSGMARGPHFPDLQWGRIRVVKKSPDYNIFMTRGYGSDGTPVNEVVLSLTLSGRWQFVSVDVLTGLDILDGSCK